MNKQLSITEWLKRWDDGDNVWSVEMGGIGPGYEQVIQIIVAEVVRYLISNRIDIDNFSQDDLDVEISKKLTMLGLDGITGAQWGAACNLAFNLYRRGPTEALGDERIQGRLILVSKYFPTLDLSENKECLK